MEIHVLGLKTKVHFKDTHLGVTPFQCLQYKAVAITSMVVEQHCVVY